MNRRERYIRDSASEKAERAKRLCPGDHGAPKPPIEATIIRSAEARYGAKYSEIGQPLRGQIEELLAPPVACGDRDCGHDVRPATKKSIRDFLCRFVGYVTGVRGVKISSLDQLLTRDLLEEFVRWCQDSRDVKTNGIKAHLACLHAAVAKSQQPALAGKDFHWIRELRWELRHEPASQIRQRKAAKWVDYELLEQIPAKIRARAEALPCHQSRRYAALRRDELIFRWLLILPWRSRNLRECRVGEENQGGNLFKCELTPFFTVAKPDWVKQALRVNPHEKFWMFYFREHETKGGREVRSLLPEQLVAPLEEYLRDYRPILLGNNNEACSPLFPSTRGTTLCVFGLGSIIRRHSLRSMSKPVNPHLIRDIVTVVWLDHHPGDYLTISNLLWHRSVLTTLRVYAQNFDESHAVCRMDAWLKSRGTRDIGQSANAAQSSTQESQIPNQSIPALIRWAARFGSRSRSLKHWKGRPYSKRP